MKTAREVLKDDPPAVFINDDSDYLERPRDGWVISDDRFIGIGYHGNEDASLDVGCKPAAAGLGHVPPYGYG